MTIYPQFYQANWHKHTHTHTLHVHLPSSKHSNSVLFSSNHFHEIFSEIGLTEKSEHLVPAQVLRVFIWLVKILPLLLCFNFFQLHAPQRGSFYKFHGNLGNLRHWRMLAFLYSLVFAQKILEKLFEFDWQLDWQI